MKQLSIVLNALLRPCSFTPMNSTNKAPLGAAVSPEGPSRMCIDRANSAASAASRSRNADSRAGLHRIVPEPVPQENPRRKDAIARLTRAVSMRRMLILPTFWEVFGLASVPVVGVALVCLCWTAWLVILTLAPNETANFLVSTEDFDDGRFWVLVDQSAEMKAVVTAVLAVVVVSYGHVLVKVVRHRPSMQQTWIQRLERRLDKWTKASSGTEDVQSRAARALRAAFAHWRELTGFRGRNRKFWNLWLKLMDLLMQTLVLRQMMLDGVPQVILTSYTAFLVVHSAVFAAVLAARYHTALGEILIDSAFDLVATIVFPILTLLHAYATCDIDYESFRIYKQVLPAGSFERRARMMADPSEVARFRSSFDALRVKTAADLFLRVGMNGFFSYRFNRVVEELVRQHATRKRASAKKILADQRHVPRTMSLLFVGFGVAVAAVVASGFEASHKACNPYPQCVAHAYWSASDGLCPCLTLIDVDLAPKTFDDWLHPPDVTDAVRALSKAGALKTLQIVNRELPKLPDELRACDRLELLSLVYTGTASIPSWLKSFKKLEYLHIDGRFGGATLQELPSDLFSDFPSLLFLQVGVHLNLKRLPALSGLPNLRSLFLARLFAVTELPPLSSLPLLERVDSTYLPSLRTLPDLGPVDDSLVHFALYRPSHACCNGFLGVCNLSHPFCAGIPSASIPIAACVDCEADKATPATISTINRFNASVCQPSTIDFASDFPSQARMDMCGGVLYRECRVGDTPGICYNSRLQGIGCSTDENKVEIRRLQIARGAGLLCDRIHEGWLGCGI